MLGTSEIRPPQKSENDSEIDEIPSVQSPTPPAAMAIERPVTPLQLLESWIEIHKDEAHSSPTTNRKNKSSATPASSNLSSSNIPGVDPIGFPRAQHSVVSSAEQLSEDEVTSPKTFDDLSRSLPISTYPSSKPHEDVMHRYLSMLSKSFPDMPPPTSPPIYPTRGLANTPPPMKVSLCQDPSQFSQSHPSSSITHDSTILPGTYNDSDETQNINSAAHSPRSGVSRSTSPLSFTSSVASALLNSDIFSRSDAEKDGSSNSSIKESRSPGSVGKRLRKRKPLSPKNNRASTTTESSHEDEGINVDDDEKFKVPYWWLSLFGTNDPEKDEWWYSIYIKLTTPTLNILSFVSVSVVLAGISFGTGYYLGSSSSSPTLQVDGTIKKSATHHAHGILVGNAKA